MLLPAQSNPFHDAIIVKHPGIYCHISVIFWPNSYRSANLNTNGDHRQKIEGQVHRLNTSRTMLHHANNIIKALCCQSDDHLIDQDNIGANDGSSNDEADDEYEDTQKKLHWAQTTATTYIKQRHPLFSAAVLFWCMG